MINSIRWIEQFISHTFMNRDRSLNGKNNENTKQDLKAK